MYSLPLVKGESLLDFYKRRSNWAKSQNDKEHVTRRNRRYTDANRDITNEKKRHERSRISNSTARSSHEGSDTKRRRTSNSTATSSHEGSSSERLSSNGSIHERLSSEEERMNNESLLDFYKRRSNWAKSQNDKEHVTRRHRRYTDANRDIINEKRRHKRSKTGNSTARSSHEGSSSERLPSNGSSHEGLSPEEESINNFLGSQISESELKKLLNRIDKRFCHANTVVDETGEANSDKQRANICVVCDRFIIGMEEVKMIEKETLIKNANRLSVSSYEEHFCLSMKRELISQYEVHDDDLKGLLLSPRAQCIDRTTYQCCCQCYNSCVQGSKKECSSPPKYSIANGFAIGHIPDELLYIDNNGDTIRKEIDREKHLTDILCGSISPVRPFGRVFAYHGGKQKSIKGHFSLFSVDQSHVGGVINKYRSIDNAAKNIFVVLCGRMTPGQKEVIRREAELDADIFLHLLNWFIKSSGHPAYDDVTPPEDCPDPVAVLQDEDTQNNTDDPVNPSVECKIEGKTYYFSNESQQPDERNSVFDSNQQFLEAMLKSNAPTMLMYGGSYLKSHEINLEDAFPIQFPFGLGGPVPHIKRKVPVSIEACLRHYMRLSLNQFMRPDFILVCYHIWCRNSSYQTGLIKCKSNYKGKALGERISELSVDDIREASIEMSEAQVNNTLPSRNSTATSFLKRITTSCKVLGHTTEAAKDARRKTYALTERFGSHSLFFTVTPDDECTFRVRMYANMGESINLPSVDCCEDDCFADFTVWQKTRLKYPGACSLYYQSVIQAVYELLGWDLNKNCKKGKGVFGEPNAICHGDEEQGRTTLHGHFLVWLKHFEEMRELLFHHNEVIQDRARDILRQYIDHHFCSDYGYDRNLPVIHEECEQCLPLSEMFKQTEELQTIRDGRNKTLVPSVCGQVLTCTSCGSGVSTPEVFGSVMKSYKKQSDDVGMTAQDDNVVIPPNRHRQDIMTYRCMIDDLHNSEEFFFNRKVRSHVSEFRMNEHDWKHRKPCFKHGLECRFDFPMQCHECGFVEDNMDPMKATEWNYVCPGRGSKDVFPYSVLSTRNDGSQYLNTHSRTVTEKFGCNSNIQMGSPRCVFYVVHYTTKLTQKEDRGPDYDRIGKQVIKRILKERNKLSSDSADAVRCGDLGIHLVNETEDRLANPDSCFREGLCRYLIGMSVHLSQDVVSATMAHLIMSKKGSRFSFSHEFQNLMVSQMINHLNGKAPGDFVLRRRNKGKEGELYMWPDNSINDYIYRSSEIEDICFYEFGMKYEKIPFSFDRMKKMNEQGLPILNDGEMHFEEEHPGRRYCYLKRSSKETVPLLSTPTGALCDITKLDVENENPSEVVLQMRREYAEVALVLFYPFRSNDIFSFEDTDGSLWGKLQRLMLQSQQPENSQHAFFHLGVQILQNIQDRIQSGKCRLPVDPLQSETCLNTENCEDEVKRDYDSENESIFDDAVSIGDYVMGECHDYDDFVYEKIRRLDDFKKGNRLVPNSIIDARAYTDASLFCCDSHNSDIIENEVTDVASDTYHGEQNNSSKYKTLLGFVAGASLNLVRDNDDSDVSEHADMQMSDEELNASEGHAFMNEIDWEIFGFSPDFNRSSIPTMSEVAEQMKTESNIMLDRIQYAAYEIICSSFLLNMVNEGWKDTGSLSESFASGFGASDDEKGDPSVKRTVDLVIQNLKNLGAEDQLLMFVTGPAGAGKSTAITVAQKFCYEFCRSLGVSWGDNTFMFTATTGCAAALFGGNTIHSAAFLNTPFESITDAMMRQWKDVKILIIDEVSMATDDLMNKLNRYLNHFRRCVDPTSHVISSQMIFGGYSIIYSGDFRQIPPVAAPSDQVLYKTQGLWENSINVAVVFQNSHRFSDDPSYGEVLMRMWRGIATREDIDLINSRMIGHDSVFPDVAVDSDVAYACPINSERTAIHASIFQRHIQNFPSVDDDVLPPDHTVILEADIRQAPKKKPKRKRGEADVESQDTIRMKVDPTICDRIYSKISDSQLKDDRKPVDPALKLYVGANCMITDNICVAEGLANGTLCRVVSIIMKTGTGTSLGWRNYDGRKVYYANVDDISHVVFEHFPKSRRQIKLQEELSVLKHSQSHVDKDIFQQKTRELEVENRKRTFILKPRSFSCTFYLEDLQSDMKVPSKKKTAIKVTVRQLPIILNDATTGHKLQGMSKDQVIVQSWDYRNEGWIYTVLSRVRKLLGLYTCERLDYRKYHNSVQKNAEDLRAFDERMKLKIPRKAQV